MLTRLSVLVLLAGCTAGPTAHAPPRARHLDASVTQFRFDEGTRNLKAGVTNNGSGDIRVTRATIRWGGLAFPTVSLPDEAIHPGQTAAFTIAYGAPRCTRPRPGRPVLMAVVDDQSRHLPLRVEDPRLLDRLRVKACAQRRLAREVTVRLQMARRTQRIRGEEYLPGDLVLTHRPGSRSRVTLVDLGGSVLLDLVPRSGPATLPTRLAPGRARRDVPVLFGSAHRCDAHALSQSSQTFLVSAYVRLPGRSTQRLILPLESHDKDRLFGVVRRDCR